MGEYRVWPLPRLLIMTALAVLFGAQEAFAATTLNAQTGVLMGRVYMVPDNRCCLLIAPVAAPRRKQLIYLDKETKYFVNHKRSSLENVYVGDRVAIRYFGEEKLLIADAVFVVFGQFGPQESYEKPTKKAKVKAGGKASGKASNKH